METSIERIVQKLYALPEVKILEVLDFVEFLLQNLEEPTVQPLEEKVAILDDETFEAIAHRLAKDFKKYVGSNVQALSDYTVSRAGTYEEHP